MTFQGIENPDKRRWKNILFSIIKPISYALVFFVATLTIAWITNLIAGPSAYKVDRDTCSCDCFDRQLKGGYFNSKRQFKYIYINFEMQSVLILVWTGFYGFLLLQSIDYIIKLLWKRKLDFLILLGFIFSCFGQAYNWNCFWNYINDDLYHLFPTQLFFVITEWLATISLFKLLSKDVEIENQGDEQILPSKWIIASQAMSLCHVMASLEDQGFKHIFLEASKMNFFFRDVMLILSDLVPFVVIYHRMNRELCNGKATLLIILGAFAFWGIYVLIKHVYGYS